MRLLRRPPNKEERTPRNGHNSQKMSLHRLNNPCFWTYFSNKISYLFPEYSIDRSIEVVSMHKNGVLIVVQTMLSAREKRRLTNNDFNVLSAIGRIFGNPDTIISHVPSTGSGYGSSRAIRFDYSVNYQLIAPPNCIVSRIIGWNTFPRNNLIIPTFDIWFTMLLISIRMVAC